MPKVICMKCGIEFFAPTSGKYCSKCHTYKCLNCGKEFDDKKQMQRKFCSQECSNDYRSKNNINNKLLIICKFCGKEFYVFKYRANAKYCSQKCLSKDKVGENAKNWQGGITPENHSERYSDKSKNWRISVFERDNYTCQMCKQVGYKLNAHHIIPFSKDKSLRFELSNGITLCVKCHKKIHLLERQRDKFQFDLFSVSCANKKGSINVRKNINCSGTDIGE